MTHLGSVMEKHLGSVSDRRYQVRRRLVLSCLCEMTAEHKLVIRNPSALESLGNDKDMPPTFICFRRVR
jgi:hypothetical protein